jgi:hypothetical protein
MPEGMTIPPREIPVDDDGYFEVLTKVIFQSGFRWSVVENKWPGFREAFSGFDIDAVASYGPPELEKLISDERIVRNGRKIEATVENAITLRQLIDEYGSVAAWLESTAGLPWPDRRKAVSGPLKYFGPGGVFHFLWCVGQAVPPYEQRDTWLETVPPGSPESLP